MKQEKLLLAQNQETREKILYLFNLYMAQNRIPELLKLFKHTISYVAKHEDRYSCTCKFSSESSTNRECSHIQTIWILKEKTHV